VRPRVSREKTCRDLRKQIQRNREVRGQAQARLEVPHEVPQDGGAEIAGRGRRRGEGASDKREEPEMDVLAWLTLRCLPQDDCNGPLVTPPRLMRCGRSDRRVPELCHESIGRAEVDSRGDVGL